VHQSGWPRFLVVRSREPDTLFYGVEVGLVTGISSGFLLAIAPLVEAWVDDLPDRRLGGYSCSDWFLASDCSVLLSDSWPVGACIRIPKLDSKVKGPILLAGATGGVGRAVVEGQRTRGLPVRVLDVALRLSPDMSALCLAACLSIALTGCDPIVTIAGATFPSWLLCLIVGAILTAVVRSLVVLARLEPHLGPLTIFYPSLIAMFAMIVWVIFFNRV
jgi:hypothetical protein